MEERGLEHNSRCWDDSRLGGALWNRSGSQRDGQTDWARIFSLAAQVRTPQNPRVNIKTILRRHVRFNRCRKTVFWSFHYLTKSRNFWEMKTSINSLFEAASKHRRETESKPPINPRSGEFDGQDRKKARTTKTNIITNFLISHLFS